MGHKNHMELNVLNPKMILGPLTKVSLTVTTSQHQHRRYRQSHGLQATLPTYLLITYSVHSH